MQSIDQVCQQYRELRFNGIADTLPSLLIRAEENDLSYLQFAAMLVEDEQGQRNSRRIALNRRKASFPVIKRLEEFDYRHQTTITKRQVNQLLDFTFIDNRENLVFIGPPGVGKTHLSTAIGEKALDQGYKVWFTTA
jgi:DNA replication protein DnaC